MMKNWLNQLKDHYLCPILKVPIKDPVITDDGHTYERQGIQKWFETSQKSPITGLKLQTTKLIPNLAFKNLRQIIETAIKQNQTLKSTNQKISLELNYQQNIRTSKQTVLKEYMKQLEVTEKFMHQTEIQQEKSNLLIQELNLNIAHLQQLKEKSYKEKIKNEKIISQLQKKLQSVKEQAEQKLLDISSKIKESNQILHNKTYELHNILLNIIFQILSKRQKHRDIDNRIENNLDDYQFTKYKMQRFLISNTNTNCYYARENLLKVFYRLYNESLIGFSQVYNVISIKTLLQVEGNIKQYPNNIQLYDKFKQSIEGIEASQKQTNNDQWEDIMQIASQYPNIKSIVIDKNGLSKINKSDLQKISNLKYLRLRKNELDNQSLIQLQQYRNQNPDVILVLNQHKNQNYSSDQW